MKIKAGTESEIKIHCGWKRKDGSVPTGDDEDFCLLDDGKPVRFIPRLHVPGTPMEMKAVYSFSPKYATAPIEEGRDIERIDIPRREVKALFEPAP